MDLQAPLAESKPVCGEQSEWIDLEHVSSPSLIGTVGEQLARLHLTTQGLEDNFGFHVDTYLGQRRQDNARDNDLLSFFVQRRLDPEVFPCDTRQTIKHLEGKGLHNVQRGLHDLG